MWRNKTHDLSNLQFYTENEKGERMLTVFCRNVKFVYKCPFRLCDPPLTFSELFTILHLILMIIFLNTNLIK